MQFRNMDSYHSLASVPVGRSEEYIPVSVTMAHVKGLRIQLLVANWLAMSTGWMGGWVAGWMDG